jgi:hypothetical protein
MNVIKVKKDSFWLWFGLFVALAGVALISAFALMFTLVPEYGSDTPAQVTPVDLAGREPFPFVETPYIYRNALTYGWEDWSWNSAVDFSSKMFEHRGNVIRIQFLSSYAGFRVEAPSFDTEPYESLEFQINIAGGYSSNLTVGITDLKGSTIGSRLIGESIDLDTYTWHPVLIPLDNLSATNKQIGGIYITSDTAGVIYLDNLKFKMKTDTPPSLAQEGS